VPMNIDPLTLDAVKDAARSCFSLTRQIRRDLHQHPELSGQESFTSNYLAEKLTAIGLDVHTGVGGLGLVANLVTDLTKPTTALRVDMDALPIQEVNNVDYRSKINGISHACGHDVHSAIGVGIAYALTKLKHLLPGNLRILFQPEEEEITGALKMIHAGALSHPKPRAIFGIHVAPLPVGQIAWTNGLFLAGFDHYLASLSPQVGTTMSTEHLDALCQYCCNTIQKLNQWHLPLNWDQMQTFWEFMQNGSSGLQNFIIYEASLNQDDRDAWHGQFGIGIKAASHHLRKTAVGRIKAALNPICQTTRTEFHLETMGRMPDMRNNSDLVLASLPALKEAIGEQNLIHLKAAFPFNCEDFSYYTKYIPGAMYWLGAANPKAGKYALLHTPDFDVDERCIETGILGMATLIIESLLFS